MDANARRPSLQEATHLKGISKDAYGQEVEDIDDLLDAEQRELEAMIEMHEAAQEPADDTRTRPAMLHQQSSPFLGPDDADFEEFMSYQLSADDAMDIS